MAEGTEVEQNRIGFSCDEALNLARRIKSSRYWSEDQGVIKRDDKCAAILPQDPP